MPRSKVESGRLRAEILNYVKNAGEATGYRVYINISAPKPTVLWQLKEMVAKGILDCREDRRAKVYSLPKAPAVAAAKKETTAPKMVSRGPKKARSC